MKNINILAIVLLLVGLGGGFFAGMKYQQNQTPQRGQFRGQGQNQGRQGSRPVSGEILSLDGKSITVKLQDGSSKIVLLTDTTSIGKTEEASKSALVVGEKVAIFGSDNSDGSVTAQNIQLNPGRRGGMVN